MNKYVSLVLIVLAALLIASCAPATLPAPAVVTVQSVATTAPVAQPAATKVATADARPIVPAPAADGSRPLARLSPAERTDRFSGPAATFTKPNVLYVATIVTTKGNIVAELYSDAPLSVNNFVTLAKNGYYDGLAFHRVEPSFVVQGGDPKGDGSGGPGYTVPAEIKHTHPRGALAWARTGDQVNPERRSSGSQFYITLDATEFLDGAYTVFGQVVAGMEVADQIKVGDKITQVDISEATVSRALTPAPSPVPTMTPVPKLPKLEPGRPLAKLPVEQRQDLYNTPPAMTIDTTKTYQATLESAKGKVVFDLDAKIAPVAVNNFVTLANLGFYDGMPVAFVEQGAIVLIGSPASSPESHVGYLLKPEVAPNAGNIITGTVLLYPMPDAAGIELLANGSQFFIALSEQPNDGAPITAFGKVVSGLDVAVKLVVSDVITSITISEK